MADWQVLGDVNYRKLSVYEEMSWGQLDLDNYVVYGAPYGGPIALIRDDASSSASEAVSVSSAGKKDKISVYTAAGKKISDVRTPLRFVIRIHEFTFFKCNFCIDRFWKQIKVCRDWLE